MIIYQKISDKLIVFEIPASVNYALNISLNSIVINLLLVSSYRPQHFKEIRRYVLPRTCHNLYKPFYTLKLSSRGPGKRKRIQRKIFVGGDTQRVGDSVITTRARGWGVWGVQESSGVDFSQADAEWHHMGMTYPGQSRYGWGGGYSMDEGICQ